MNIPNYTVHTMAIVKNCTIGENTVIWHFANIYKATIGKQVNIGAYTEIQKAVIGDRCRIASGCFIPNGVIIKDDCFIGPKVCFTTDKYPRAVDGVLHKGEFKPEKPTIVENGASIGANSTILPGITIGENALIGAGSIVTKDVPENATWIGTSIKGEKNV